MDQKQTHVGGHQEILHERLVELEQRGTTYESGIMVRRATCSTQYTAKPKASTYVCMYVCQLGAPGTTSSTFKGKIRTREKRPVSSVQQGSSHNPTDKSVGAWRWYSTLRRRSSAV